VRELFASLAGVALFALPGLALTSFFPGLRTLPWGRRLGYGYLLGTAAVAGALYALSALLGVPLRRPAVFGTAAVLMAAGLVKALLAGRHPSLPRRLTGRARWAALALAAVGAAVSAGLLADAVSEPLRDWDGRMHWAAQARYIRYEGTVLPLAIVRGQWFVNHPRYPVLLPVAQVAVLEATGAGEDETFFRAVYAAFFPALLLVVYDGARRWAGWLPAGLTVAAASGLPFLTYFVDGGAAGAYSDLPLACFYGAAVILLLHSRVHAADGIAAGLLLGAAVLTKNEGTILAGFALVAATLPLLRFRRELRRKDRGVSRKRLLLRGARLGTAASAMLAILAFFVFWRSGIPNRQDEMYENFVTPGLLWPGVVTHMPELMGAVLARTFLTWRHWIGFWWVVPFVLVAGRSAFQGRRAALSWPLALAALAPLCIGWGAYTVRLEPADYLIPVTWERFLVQASVPFLVLFSLALREALRRGLPPRGLARLSQ
jgi:hypothetical protein